jgi:hypothetical protein
MLIYGSRATQIGNFIVDGSKCSHCGNEGTQRMTVFGKYGHIFWIPMFPIGKKAVSECTHCKKTIDDSEFDMNLRSFYNSTASAAKSPIWQWAGLLLVGGLIALGFLIGMLSTPDPRQESLSADIKAMSSSPTMESDSIGFKLKKVFDLMVTEEIKSENFKYLTKIKDNKVLILVQIPNLKKVDKSARTEVIELVESVIENQAGLEGKEKYIGVHGTYNMMMVKTPSGEQNSKVVSDAPLYEFYGALPAKQ